MLERFGCALFELFARERAEWMGHDDGFERVHAERFTLDLGLVQEHGRNKYGGRYAQCFEPDGVVRTARRA